MFEHVEPFGGDPILSLNEDFQKDPRPGKINLSIGIYFDDAGRIPVLESVRQGELKVVARNAPKPYLPIEGAANFREEVQKLLFGAGHEAITSGRVATIQAVGSSGGLKVGAEKKLLYFLAKVGSTFDRHLFRRRRPRILLEVFVETQDGVAAERLDVFEHGLPLIRPRAQLRCRP